MMKTVKRAEVKMIRNRSLAGIACGALWGLLLVVSPLQAQAGLGFGLNVGRYSGTGDAHSGYNKAGLSLGFEMVEVASDKVDLGVFYQRDFVSRGGDSGSVQFMGGILRLSGGQGFPLFMEGRLGATKLSSSAIPSSRFSMGVGGAVGFRFAVSDTFGISPYFGLRSLDHWEESETTKRRMMDLGLQFRYQLGGSSSRGRPRRR